MIPHRLLRQHHLDALDNLHAAGMLTADTLQGLSALSFRHLRSQTSAGRDQAHDLVSGRAVQMVDFDSALGVMRESIELLSSSYARWIELVEAQLQLMRLGAHEGLEDLRRWTPREAELALTAAGLAVDAVESSAELLADASVAASGLIEEQATVPAGRSSRRRAGTGG